MCKCQHRHSKYSCIFYRDGLQQKHRVHIQSRNLRSIPGDKADNLMIPWWANIFDNLWYCSFEESRLCLFYWSDIHANILGILTCSMMNKSDIHLLCKTMIHFLGLYYLLNKQTKYLNNIQDCIQSMYSIIYITDNYQCIVLSHKNLSNSHSKIIYIAGKHWHLVVNTENKS